VVGPLTPAPGESHKCFVARWDVASRGHTLEGTQKLFVYKEQRRCSMCPKSAPMANISIACGIECFTQYKVNGAVYLCNSCDARDKSVDVELSEKLWKDNNTQIINVDGWTQQRLVRLVCKRGPDQRNSYGCRGDGGIWWCVFWWHFHGAIRHDFISATCSAITMQEEQEEKRIAWLVPLEGWKP
jgi:hypothetical protein